MWKGYGIDPNLILNRILHEGWIDQHVGFYNDLDAAGQRGYWDNLWDTPVSGYGSFGLDYAGHNLMNGAYELKDPNASWSEAEFTDYEGGKGFRAGTSLEADNLSSAIEILAADLAYRRGEVAKRYGKSGSDLDIWTNAAFNMGLSNDDLKNDEWVRKQYTYPDYYGRLVTEKRLGGLIEKYGRSGIVKALGGRINKYDGKTEDTGKMSVATGSSVWSDPAGMLLSFPKDESTPVDYVSLSGPYVELDADSLYGGDVAPAVVIADGPKNDKKRVDKGSATQRSRAETKAYLERRKTLAAAIAQNPQAVRDALANIKQREVDISHNSPGPYVGVTGADKNGIEKMVASLRDGDELRDFQKMLFEKGYYGDTVPVPKITAKTKAEIEALQRKLKDAGYDLGNYGPNKDGIDGRIGNKTRLAWQQYVKEHPDEALLSYIADGHVGPKTRAAARAYYNDISKGSRPQYGSVQDPSKIENIAYNIARHIPGLNYFVPMSFPGSEERARDLGYRTYIDQQTGERKSVQYPVTLDGIESPSVRDIAAAQMRQYGIPGDFVRDKSAYQRNNYAYLPAYGYNFLAPFFNKKEGLPVADPFTGRAVRLGADRVETGAEKVKDWYNRVFADKRGKSVVYTYADASPAREDYRNLYFGYPQRNNTLKVNENVDRMNSGEFRTGYAFVPRDTNAILALANGVGVEDGVQYTSGHQLGNFGYGTNADNERWYYDDWDLIGDNTKIGFSLIGGKPFQVYDRDSKGIKKK